MKKNFLQRTLVLCLFAPLFTVFSCSQPKSLTILHTNDIHAGFVPHEATWIQATPRPMIGGFRELFWIVDSIRRAKGDVLLLDAGDVMTGNPISTIEHEGAKGGALFEMMNKVGYDAWAIGNHDLDVSQDNLRRLTRIARFPTLSANVTDSAGNFVLNNKDYVIILKSGLRIGVLGLTTTDLFNVTNTNNLLGLKVIGIAPVTQRIIDKISPETDLIVAVTHDGVEDDSLLAAATHGLNVIIGGHSHTRLREPRVVNGVVICQTGSNCENLGDLDITVDAHKIVSFQGKLIALWERKDRPENEMSRFVDEFRSKIEKEFGEVIGTLTDDWKRSRSGESNIGGFAADAIREAGKADIGISNSSGIRKDLSAGPIRRLDLFEISPFGNVICTFTAPGASVRGLVTRYLQTLISGRTSIDISGITCTWKRGPDGQPQIQKITIAGEDLKDDRQYLWATHDFVMNQKEKYLGFSPPGSSCGTETVSDALMAKVERDKTIHSALARRFQEVP